MGEYVTGKKYYLVTSLLDIEFLIITTKTLNHSYYKKTKPISKEDFELKAKNLNVVSISISGEVIWFTYNKKELKFICKYNSSDENLEKYNSENIS